MISLDVSSKWAWSSRTRDIQGVCLGHVPVHPISCLLRTQTYVWCGGGRKWEGPIATRRNAICLA